MSAQSSLAVVQQFAELLISPAIGHTQRTNIVGMIVAAWVMAHTRAGTFDMVPRDFQTVERTYQNCARILGRNSFLGIAAIGELLEAGLMPETRQSTLADAAEVARQELCKVEMSSPSTRTMTDEELDRRRAALDLSLNAATRKR